MSAVRFTVTKANEVADNGEAAALGYGAVSNDDAKTSTTVEIVGDGKKGENSAKESDVLVENEVAVDNMALYAVDLCSLRYNEPILAKGQFTSATDETATGRPYVARIISQLANYEGGVQPEVIGDDEDQTKQKKKASKLGTVLGVYFPCIQNIFGVILFVRLVWIVGVAGWVEAFFIVFLCCCCTMLTAISMSAIATNGVVPGGGSYFLISRSLGPEFGGAVGMLFYFATSMACSMYIVGAVEILLQYMSPTIAIFKPITDDSNAFNNYRIFGTCLLIIMFIWVFLGVKFVSKFSPVALFCVIISIIAIYIGIFYAGHGQPLEVCYVGDRLLTMESIKLPDGSTNCSKYYGGPIYERFCNNNASNDCDYYTQNDVTTKNAIPGLSSGVFGQNALNKYNERDERIGEQVDGNRNRGEIVADITTSFIILLGIFFPSCTGIMAGSNRSGDLADAQKSIPIGTIAAIATTSFVYLSCVLFFGATIEGQVLRDKFGESLGGELVVSKLAWPNPWVILIGSFLSTVGAGLQSLTGAPRLLQAIASDGVIPFLNPLSVKNSRGEPFRALMLTACITELGVLIGSLDYISPIITMFFLMCYGFVNLACALQTLLRTPNWRPRFRFYHWTLSLVGVALCIAIMFISSWYYALAAIFIAVLIYKYIEFKGPQVLILVKLDSELKVKHPKILGFSSQLKAGKGLTMVASVLQGTYEDRFADAQAAKQSISQTMKRDKVKGFAEVLCSTDISQGLNHLVQTSGVGGLRHNTVLLGWPHGWRHNENEASYRPFVDTLRNISSGQMCVMIPKGVDSFPDPNTKEGIGYIDVWWIVHDGGLLMLLPFLLTQHKTYRQCKLRIFTVAQMEDNSIQIRTDLERFLYHLRISATPDSDISAYTYERTLMMEQRTEMLKEMRLKKKEAQGNPQSIVDTAHARPMVAPVKIDIQVDPSSEDGGDVKTTDEQKNAARNIYTFTGPNSANNPLASTDLTSLKPHQQNVRRMHTAVRLNEVIVEKSHEAKLVIMNLPGPPRQQAGEQNYMEFLEVLTEGLERVLMVRGGGREVITIFS